MKKLYQSSLTLFVSLLFTTINAQDYQISFAGIGASTIVETVEVKNITQGTNITLTEGEVLHLKNGITTSVRILSSDEKELVVYPNPIIEQGEVEFIASQSGVCFIEVYTLMGSKILSKKYNLLKGIQSFTISGLATGMYALNIQSENYSYSSKIISKGSSEGNPNIIRSKQVLNKELTNLKNGTASNLVEFEYDDGDLLHIIGKSGIYQTVKAIVPTSTTTEFFEFQACTDGDGNNYKIVEIGNQIWMAENLKTTKFNNSDEITLITSSSEWNTIDYPAYCWYENNAIANDYGALYNWYTVESGNVCPTNWHVPTDEEWKTLEVEIGMSITDVELSSYRGTDEGLKLKSTIGWNTNENGTDVYGFSALPTGYRFYFDGVFYKGGLTGLWWSSTEQDNILAVKRAIDGWYKNIGKFSTGKNSGIAIRCIKD